MGIGSWVKKNIKKAERSVSKRVKKTTDSLGLTAFEEEDRAENAARQNRENQRSISQQSLDFNKEQYMQWSRVFGDLYENLGSYYRTLTPQRISSIGVREQQKAFDTANENIKKQFSRRGITNSNLYDYTLAQANYQNEVRKAEIRASAPEKTAQLQSQFLQPGLQQQAALLGQTNAAYANQSNVYGGQAIQQEQIRQNAAARNQAFTDTLINTATFGASGGFSNGGLSNFNNQNQQNQRNNPYDFDPWSFNSSGSYFI